MKIISLICDYDDCDIRLDKFIIRELKKDDELKDFFSRNRVKELIKNSFVKKNDAIFSDISYRVKNGDSFEIILNDIEAKELKGKDISLNIIYEDDNLMVINKQAGLTVHPGAGNYDNTLVNGLIFHCKGNLSTVGGMFRTGIVHRLDKDTTGLMVIAKNNLVHRALQEQLEERTLKRTYNAIIWGNIIPKNGVIENYIDRSANNRLKMEINENGVGKYSKTNYITLEEFSTVASLIECKLDTGRTHQIRVHFSSKKCPLIGDQFYGGNSRKMKGEVNEFKNFIDEFPRQALHSKSLSFTHPVTGENMSFDSELPNDMKILLNCLKFYKYQC
jgi:23S rRNA pseudouridine1911/1915/1917 synthase